MTRAPGIVAVALVLRAGGAGAAPAAEPPPDSPALTQSLAVEAAPVPEGAATPSVPTSLEQLPLESRTHPLLYVGEHVPGVVTVEGGLSIHGGEARETALFVDDARTSRLVLPLGMLDRLSVLTAGYGAPLADVTGGAVVASTRRETPALSLELGHARELNRRGDDVTSLGLGTPLVRDRLFLRVAAELQLERWDGARDGDGILPPGPDPTQRTGRGAAKLIWLARADQRVELLAAGNFSRQDNSATLGIGREAQPRYESGDLALSARWAGALGRRLTGRAQLYGERNAQHEQPLGCAGAEGCLPAPMVQTFPRQLLLGNWTRDSDAVQRALELVAAVEAPLPETTWLRPSLRFTSRARASDHRVALSVPGDRIIRYQGSVPERETLYYANDPRVAEPAFGPFRQDASALRAVQSLEAPLSLLSRVQLVPGVALVSARARTGRGDHLRQLALAPGVSATWQVLRRLPVFVRASRFRRVDADLDLVSRSTLSSPVARSCLWNVVTNAFDRDCTYSGGTNGQSLGLPCSPAGVDAAGQPCRGQIEFPRSWDNTVGFGVVPIAWLRADVDLVHRRGTGLWRIAETNRIWNQSGATLGFTGAYRNGRAQTVNDLSTLGSAQRRHRSLHTTITATPGPVALTLAHVHSRNHAPAESDFGIPAAVVLDGDDQGRHFIYGQAAADLDGYVSVGALYAYAQGPLFSRLFRNDVTGTWDNYRATRGVNPGTNINDPSDDTPLRLPSTQQLSLQLRARGRRVLGIDADVYLDVMHLFQTRRSTVAADDSRSFTNPVPSGADSWYRLGLEYRY